MLAERCDPCIAYGFQGPAAVEHAVGAAVVYDDHMRALSLDS